MKVNVFALYDVLEPQIIEDYSKQKYGEPDKIDFFSQKWTYFLIR